MVIFFIIISLLFFIFLFFFILCISNLQIQLKDLIVDSTNEKEKKIQNYIIYIRLKALNKLTFFKIKLDKEKIKKSIELNKNTLSKVKKILNTKKILKNENNKLIRQINIKIEKLDLYLKIGLLDTFFTSMSIAFLSGLISILLAKMTDEYYDSKYIIIPEYNSELLVKMKLNCIINIKMIHIINVIYMLINSKRSVKYDERTSNRRAYASCNGKH